MEYQFISGKRRNSRLLYILKEKQLYKKEDSNKKHTVYKCYLPECKARIAIDTNNICNRVSNFIEHNHPHNQEDKFTELKLIEDIKTKCSEANEVVNNASSTVGNVREIFNSVCQKYQEAANGLNFKQMQRNLLLIRNNVFKTNPKTYQNIIDCYGRPEIMEQFGRSKHSDRQDFYRGCFDKDEFCYCIFASQNVVELIQTNIKAGQRRYVMDATFKISPVSCFKQFLIIHVEYMYQVIPFIFVLMSKKSEKCYLDIFQYIHKNIITLECNSFITDFEEPMRNALRTVSPASNVYSCWFHYCQAIKQQASKIPDFFNGIRGQTDLERIYYKFLCLPLLPTKYIIELYNVLRLEAEAVNKLVFCPFLQYFEKQWIQEEGPHEISVVDRQIRTTSALEAYNDVLGEAIIKKEHFFKFVQKLQEEEFFKSREMKLLIESGGSTSSITSRKYKARFDKIEEASKRLKQQKITPTEFLNRIACAGNTIYKGFINCTTCDDSDDDNKNNVYDSLVTQQGLNCPPTIQAATRNIKRRFSEIE